MEKPLVSVVIPMYNRAELVIEAVNSVINQEYDNYEIIIGDNKSEDGSYETICNLFGDKKNIVIFQNDSNVGPVLNWINCVKKSKGKYVKILWSDDLISSNYLSSCVKYLEQYPEASFAFTSVRIFDDSKIDDIYKPSNVYFGFKKSGLYDGKAFIDKVFKESYSVPVSPGCAIFRRDKVHIFTHIDNSIGYNHNGNGAGTDLLIFLNALANKEKFVFVKETMSFFRMHEKSISISDKSINDGYFTAKIFFIKKYRMKEYTKYINSEIVSTLKGRHCFNKINNQSVLQKYYFEDEQYLCNTSIIDILCWLIKWFVYNLIHGKELKN